MFEGSLGLRLLSTGRLLSWLGRTEAGAAAYPPLDAAKTPYRLSHPHFSLWYVRIPRWWLVERALGASHWHGRVPARCDLFGEVGLAASADAKTVTNDLERTAVDDQAHNAHAGGISQVHPSGATGDGH